MVLRSKFSFSERYKDLIVILFLLVFCLRIVTWFEYPYILLSGDFRPPVVSDAFVKRVLYSWDETDFGVPSVYQPRILDPFYLFITIFQSLGLGIFLSEMLSVFLIYFLASVLMYVLVKNLTNDRLASFVAALFLTSNVYLVNDREITAIAFVDTILLVLPSLLLFMKGLKEKSYLLMSVAGAFFVLTYTTFPNYRTSLIGLLMISLVLLFLFIRSRLEINLRCHSNWRISLRAQFRMNLFRKYLKLFVVFLVAISLISIWIVQLVISNYDIFYSAYAELDVPWFIGGLSLSDVTRLIARWGFYSGAFGQPYLPYGNIYLEDPVMIAMCFLPAMLAFGSLLFSRNRRTTFFFGIVAISSLFLTTGFNVGEFGKNLYLTLVQFPLLRAFREASNWIFFAIISLGILLGCTISGLNHKFKNKILTAFSLFLLISLFLVTSFPVTTGEVSRNWLRPDIKGSFIPHSYIELNEYLPNDYWTLLLPIRNTYVVYNFTEGPLGLGNPYPLLFSKPIISGAGTEYVQSENRDLLKRIHEMLTLRMYDNIAPYGVALASSREKEEFIPGNAIDRNNRTRWSSDVVMPQWFSIVWEKSQPIYKITILFDPAYGKDYEVQTWDGSDWQTQATIIDNNSTENTIQLKNPVNTSSIRFFFTEASEFRSVSIFEVWIYPSTGDVPKFLGMLGIKNLIIENYLLHGGDYSPKDLRLGEDAAFEKIEMWNEIELYENMYALRKIYVADTLFYYKDFGEMYRFVQEIEWETIEHSAAVNSTINHISSGDLVMPEDFAWRQISSTRYDATTNSKGPFVLVLLESYEPGWKAYVNGKRLTEANHFKANEYANGWLIEETGNLSITINYDNQDNLASSVAISAGSLLLLVFAVALTERSKGKIRSIFHRSKRNST